MSDKRHAILERITEIKNRIGDLQAHLTLMGDACIQLKQEKEAAIERAEKAEAQCEFMRGEHENLKRFAYEDAPKLAAEEANKQTAALREENQLLREVCELALTLLEDGAPHTAADRLRATLAPESAEKGEAACMTI